MSDATVIGGRATVRGGQRNVDVALVPGGTLTVDDLGIIATWEYVPSVLVGDVIVFGWTAKLELDADVVDVTFTVNTVVDGEPSTEVAAVTIAVLPNADAQVITYTCRVAVALDVAEVAGTYVLVCQALKD